MDEKIADLTAQIQSLTTGQLNAVSVKLPEFWSRCPEVWFARVEAQFGTRNIVQDQTKYDYVVGALDIDTAQEVQAILTNPPVINRDVKLKSSLLKVFGKSQAQKDAELLNLSGLGDMRPTALLRRINDLNDDAKSLKRALFLSNLPLGVRSILAAQNITDLDALAEAADLICEARHSDVQKITQLPVEYVSSHKATNPQQCVEEVSPEVSADPEVAAFMKKRFVRRTAAATSAICYYHTKFGPQATNCRPGCKFASLLPKVDHKTSGNAVAGRSAW